MANRLSKESSPYLLQHQNNPVDWYAWGKEALERAQTENKPILLSIGYSACHWCHVMEHESFENQETARLMNENFINIKVDREERPDLDHIYQNVAQALTQGGGWPLTVFLTPDLKPFYGGTYFPPQDRYGRPGFPRVLLSLSHAFRSDFASVSENAQKLTEFIISSEAAVQRESKIPQFQDFQGIADSFLSRVDWEQGGLGGAPKFPNPMSLTFLWRYGVFAHHEKARQAALLALTRMASGGIYDQLGGGFHRYSVDASWSVPHFEKMLYDNALLLRLYSEVLLVPGNLISEEEQEHYLRVLNETTTYLFREMTTSEGAFYSTQDADSEGEEGKFFVWDLKDLSQLLTPKEAQVFALRYGVTETGNFEHGKTVLYLALSISEVARRSGFLESEVSLLLDQACKKLFKARTLRIPPGLDNKILTSWNALMVSGLAWTSKALRFKGQLESAEKVHKSALRCFQFLRQNLTRSQDRLFSTYQGGQAKLNGYLDDYAFMAMAALDLARCSKSSLEVVEYLNLSEKWMDVILNHFKDTSGPGYFFTSDDHEKLIQRPKTVFDQAIPSGNAVAWMCMAALSEVDLNGQGARWSREVENQIQGLFGIAEKSPVGMGEFLNLSLLNVLGPITVSGSEDLSLCWHPHIFKKPISDLAHEHLEKGTVLVCHEKTCSLPLEESQAEKLILEKLSLS